VSLPGCAILSPPGVAGSLRYYAREFGDLLRDLTPARRKSRYGDIDYDFEHSVDTTGRRFRCERAFASGSPAAISAFRAGPVCRNSRFAPVAVDGFTYIDLGSGKDELC